MTASVGLILPDDGPFDYEWLRLHSWLATGPYRNLALLVERSPADGIMQEENLLEIGSAGALGGPAERLAARGASCILWGCTSGSFAGGHEAALRQIEMLEDVSGLPATSTSMALVAAVRAIGTRQVDLLSAYDGPVTQLLVGFLADAGIEVVESRILDCITTEESVAIDIIEQVTGFSREIPGSRPILVPDTAINTLELAPELIRLAERPVVTANMASLWHAASLVDKNVDVAVAGMVPG